MLYTQITLTLAFIGYFGKRFFDLISKKREINHNLFQQHKIKAFADLLDAYSKLESVFNDLEYYKIFRGDISTDKLDSLIFPILNDFKSKSLLFQTYVDEKDRSNLLNIEKNFISINRRMQELLFDLNPKEKNLNKPIEWSNFMSSKQDENRILVQSISELVRNSYK